MNLIFFFLFILIYKHFNNISLTFHGYVEKREKMYAKLCLLPLKCVSVAVH